MVVEEDDISAVEDNEHHQCDVWTLMNCMAGSSARWSSTSQIGTVKLDHVAVLAEWDLVGDLGTLKDDDVSGCKRDRVSHALDHGENGRHP